MRGNSEEDNALKTALISIPSRFYHKIMEAWKGKRIGIIGGIGLIRAYSEGAYQNPEFMKSI